MINSEPQTMPESNHARGWISAAHVPDELPFCFRMLVWMAVRPVSYTHLDAAHAPHRAADLPVSRLGQPFLRAVSAVLVINAATSFLLALLMIVRYIVQGIGYRCV